MRKFVHIGVSLALAAALGAGPTKSGQKGSTTVPAAQSRPKSAAGTEFPSARSCSINKNLPVLHQMLGALPEDAGLRKVWPISSSDAVVTGWRKRMSDNHVSVSGYSYVGPGRDFGAECVMLGLDGGRISRVLFFFPALSPAKLASFTAPLAKAGTVTKSTDDAFSLAVDEMHLVGHLRGFHSWTVAATPVTREQALVGQIYGGHPGAAHDDSFPSAVEIGIDPVDWYLATHGVSPENAAKMRAAKGIDKLTFDEAQQRLATMDANGGRPTQANNTADAIRAAIEEHRLCVGMTLEQAESALGPKRDVVAQDAGSVTYSWPVNSWYTPPTRAGSTFAEPPRSFVSGSIVARFENGTLVRFAKV